PGFKHDAQSERRPWCRRGMEMSERRRGAIALSLEQIDPQIEGSAARQRRSLGGAILTERAGKMRVEPLRIIAGDPWRCAREIGSLDPRALVRRKRRRRKSRTACELGDCIGRKLAFEPQHAKQDPARALLLHDVGA